MSSLTAVSAYRVAVPSVRHAYTQKVTAAAAGGHSKHKVISRLCRRGKHSVTQRALSEDAPEVLDDAAEDIPYEPKFTTLSGEDLEEAIGSLKAVDIKTELQFFGANMAGGKSQLVERLVTCYALQAEGKDVKQALKERTIERLKEVGEEKADAVKRREARRNGRVGGYASAAQEAASKNAGQRKAPTLKRSRGKGIPIASNPTRKESEKSVKYIADVDLDEDFEKKSDQYKLDNPVTGRRKLNVVRRDLDRQGEFQDTMTEHGWYMVSVPETREERTALLVEALSGSQKIAGVSIETWVPRAPSNSFCVAESEANNLSRVDLLRLVPPIEDGSEKPFPGFILCKFSEMNQKVLNTLEEIYAFKGFAVGGITRYGSTRKQKSEAPRVVPAAQLEQMMLKCTPKIVSDDEFKHLEKEKKRIQKEEEEALKLEQAIGGMDVASDEDIKRTMGGRDDEASSSVSDVSEDSLEDSSAISSGATMVEVKLGPFMGFKGFITGTNDDGSVEATLTIFGRETAVTLQTNEFE